jgi:hypothetical protein
MKARWFRSALLAAALPACDDGAVQTPVADSGTPDALFPDASFPGAADAAVGLDSVAPEEDASAAADAAPEADTATPEADTATPEADVAAPEDAATGADTATTEDTSAPDDTTPPEDTAVTADTAAPEDASALVDTADPVDTAAPESVPLATLLAPFDGSANGFETAPAKRVDGLVVTLVKPTVGTEMGGFFAQEGQSGPAIFVASPTMVAEAVPGATVSIQVDQLRNVYGMIHVTAFSGLAQTATGANVAPLRVYLDGLTEPSAFRPLVSRLMAISGELANAGVAAGGGTSGFWRFGITTPGITAPTTDVELRLPRPIVAELGLEAGCLFEIDNGAVWGYRGGAPTDVLRVQPSVYSADDLFAVCAAPQVLSAEATDPTTVVLRFNRPLLASSVDPADFAVTPTLAVEAATLGADGRSVTLTTSEHGAGLTYTVTVVGDATDVLGEPFADGDARRATFTSAPDTSSRAVFCFEDAAGTFTSTPAIAFGITEPEVSRVQNGNPGLFTLVSGSPNWAVNGAKNEPAECVAGDAATSRSKAPSGSGWSTNLDAPDTATASYYRVTFKAPAGIVRLAFDGYPSGTGPARMSIWNSAANAIVGAPFDVADSWTAHPMYAADGGSIATNAALAFSIPDSTVTPFEVRLYPFAASSASGTFRIDNLTLRWSPL